DRAGRCSGGHPPLESVNVTRPLLVTGAAGFIGHRLSEALLQRGHEVVGLDSMNDYYDVRLKEARLELLQRQPGFRFERVDLADASALRAVFDRHRPARVANMAAQAGIRYSIECPSDYVQSNLVGFANLLECCRYGDVEHLVYASSSSVYGGATKMPFSVRDPVDHPMSFYAATKKANELMAHTYSHVFRLPTTGLRFFTVYGPWGRPDMALFLFTRAMLAGETIKVFNHGDMRRDFTYIDDIVEGVVRVIEKVPEPDPAYDRGAPDPSRSDAPFRVYNIGNQEPVELLEMIRVLEQKLGIEARKELLPMQPGDVPATYADVEDLVADFDFRPDTSLDVGMGRFVDWYREFYGV